MSAALIFSIILLRRLRGKPITRGEKLSILIAIMALFYGMIPVYLGDSTASFAFPIAISTAVIGGIFAISIYLVPIRTKIRKKRFQAEILDRKESYRRGEEIRFRTYYRGELINGFYDNEIAPPKGKQFGDSTWVGQSGTTWSWAPKTLANVDFRTPGSLNGYVDQPETWNWRVPMDAPTGEYTVYMRVYNHLGPGQRYFHEQKEATFVVSD